MIHYYQQCQECGEHAFEYKKKPKAGQRIFAEDIVEFVFTNQNAIMESMQPGNYIVCKQCLRRVPLCDLTIKNVIEVEE